MIDSHCHLNFDSLQNNFSQIIKNAKENKITSILTINTDPDNFLNHYDLIKNYNSLFIAYGLHPENVSKNKLITKENILEYTKMEKVIGIGETGLDFYHSTEFKKEQLIVFEHHIHASIESNLPIIIHQRNSENEIIDILNSYKNYNLSVVFHCFTGSHNLKKFCLDNNFYISLSGIITFKNANELRNTIKDIPLDAILLETDSPFLSPVPYRGKQNEPFHVKFIAQYLAVFFNVSLNEIIKITDDNFYKLFSKAIKFDNIS